MQQFSISARTQEGDSEPNGDHNGVTVRKTGCGGGCLLGVGWFSLQIVSPWGTKHVQNLAWHNDLDAVIDVAWD